MKHISESIIGRKGTANKTIIHIPGTIEFMYEVDSLSNPLNGWMATDECDDWYLLIDQEKLIVMLWSPKANYFPFLYTDDDWKWHFNSAWNLAAKILPELKGVNSPSEIYDLISDADHWDKYTAKKAITNVSIEMPKAIETLIRDKANLHFWK